jgi:hypothetical protein
MIESGLAAVAQIAWTICCMDGATFSVEVPEHACVAEIKRAIGAAREVPYFAMELFVKDQEKALDDALRMESASRPPLFMLMKVPSERLALVALFKNTGGGDWTRNRGWKELGDDEDHDLKALHGIDEIDAEGRVTEIALYRNGCTGPIPGIAIQQLSTLQYLNLGDNQLTGAIPPELGQLGALIGLQLSKNQLSGSIPTELGQLGALQQLALDQNQLSGRIPVELGQLAALRQLVIDRNQLSGSIPAELGQLKALASVYLAMSLQAASLQSWGS